MTYAAIRKIHDADSHLMEPLDWLHRYVDPSMRERVKPMNLGGAGAMAEKAIAAAHARIADRERTDAISSGVISGPKGWAAFGAFEPAERRKALDDLGFQRQLVFSTFAGSQFMREPDLAVKYAGVRAHNRGIAEFCGGDRRMIPVAMLPLDDPERALAEAKEAARLGCGTLWIPAAPAGKRSPGHPDYDPLWAWMEGEGVAFVNHIGAGSRTLDPGYDDNGRPKPTDWLGGGENLRIKDYMVLPFAPEMFLSAMVFDGVFERFPKLKGAVVELGAGWVPSFLARLDSGQRMFRKTDPAVGALKLTASDYIRRQVKFTPFAGEDVGLLMRLSDPGLYLFSSDYPHPEGGRDPIAKFEATMEGIGEDAKDAFYARNFEAVFGA